MIDGDLMQSSAGLSAFVSGGMAGLLSAALVDFQAFRSWTRLQDALAYDWGIALWRWGQGFVVGGLAATVFTGVAA